MCELQKLYYFMLTDEEAYGVATDTEIKEICVDRDSKVWFQVLASYKEIENFVREGNTIPIGQYNIKDGILESTGKGIFLVNNL